MAEGSSIASIIGGVAKPVYISPQQLPTIPIDPPDPTYEAYGSMAWDLPSSMSYSPYQEVNAILEAWNPTTIDRLYAIEYYFINPDGAVVVQNYLVFTAGGLEFASFILHVGTPEHLITSVLFQAPSEGYKFGLRLLELEMVNDEAQIKYETSRLEILLGEANSSNTIYGGGLFNIIATGMTTLILMAVATKTVAKISKE